MSPRPTDMENAMQDITPVQARDLYRDQNQAATIGRGPATEPITKADLFATVDSYIEAGGEVHEHEHPRAGEPTDPAGWEVIADQLNSTGKEHHPHGT